MFYIKAYFIHIFIFLNINILYSQQLHHQMISADGSTKTTESGFIVTQTIGQLSITGSSNDIIQGFQQPYWNVLISNSELVENIKINHYPNPVIDYLNFSFLNYITGSADLLIFDFSGRIILHENVKIEEGIAKVSLRSLPLGTFLVYLKNDKINYYTKIIKK